ncbi:MAG: hypothetical protein WCK77_07575 [Verrucomicrobiota bacterium]
MNHLYVIAGGSSPHCDKYWPVYEFIRKECENRGWVPKILDFVGCGHLGPLHSEEDFGEGFSFPAAVGKLKLELAAAPHGATLFARSLGCDVCAAILVSDPDCLQRFRRIVFWGASPAYVKWGLAQDCKESIDDFNRRYSKDGWKFSLDLWSRFLPIEMQATQIRGGSEIILACGTRDIYTTPDWQRYLAMLINRHSECRALVAEVPDAEHGVTEDNISPRGKRAYMELLFAP